MSIRNVDWMDRALCAQIGPDLFFPPKGQDLPAVRAVCDRCPVKAQCADHALAMPASEDYGIWGGQGVTQRRRRRRAA